MPCGPDLGGERRVIREGFLLYVYPEAQAGASPSTVQGERALQLKGPKFRAEHKGRGDWAEI